MPEIECRTDKDLSLGTSRDRLQLWLLPLRGGDPACLSARERSWSEALGEARARSYRCSRALLRQLLSVELGVEPSRVPLHSPPGLPPRLGEGFGWISLSHSGDGLLIGYSREPIGVDLEPVRRPLDAAALMRRFYPQQERAQLEGLSGDALRAAVLTSWVLKEAAIKWRHRTLAAELRQWVYNHVSGQLRHLGDGVQPDCQSGVWKGWRWAAVGQDCQSVSPKADSDWTTIA
jgi:phosphopantetheinyl transferase